MLELYVVVNNYMFTQGINSVVDQFFNNKKSLKSFDIEFKGVIDLNREYNQIPERNRRNAPKPLNPRIKYNSIYNSYFGNYVSILLHSILIGKRVAKQVWRKKNNSENVCYIVQDIFAAFYMIKLYNIKNVIFMSHSYEDELEQLMMNYPFIVGKKMEKRIRYYYSFVYEHAKKTIVICNKAKEWVIEKHQNTIIEVLYNSVVDDKVVNKKKKDDRINIVMASSIGTRKGFDILLDALCRCSNDILKQFQIHIYGTGDYLDEFKNGCKKNGINNIIFYGRKEMPYKNYSEMDAYLMTSRSETLPMSIIEAMMCSLPVFSTNVGAIPEMIENGKNGYLYQPDVESIHKAIEDIVLHKDDLKTLGEESRKIYLNKFSNNSWIKQLAFILRDNK